MLIRLLSDVHLEHRHFVVPALEEDQETILVLAGDIHIGVNVRSFLEDVSSRFKHVIYVLGNHEFYGGNINHTGQDIAECIVHRENVSVLRKETVVLDGVKFFGTTLWTDMEKSNPLSMMCAEQSMADYYQIRHGQRRLIAPDTVKMHKDSVAWFAHEMSRGHNGPIVVVTHHAPSWQSIHPMYRDSKINCAFASDLDHIIQHYQPDYWFYGHTHQQVHYEIGKTKIRNNPRGYTDTENLLFDPNYRIEVK